MVNNQIRSEKIRLIDETGKQLGIIPLPEALRIAQEKGLDLIQITEKVEPPVCKITDYGKYLYNLQKKEKKGKNKESSVTKGIRLGFNISHHDLEIKAKQAEKFLKKGDKIRIEMKLKGREKIHQEFGKDKINEFIKIIEASTPIKIERELKKEPRGLTMIISKA